MWRRHVAHNMRLLPCMLPSLAWPLFVASAAEQLVLRDPLMDAPRHSPGAADPLASSCTAFAPAAEQLLLADPLVDVRVAAWLSTPDDKRLMDTNPLLAGSRAELLTLDGLLKWGAAGVACPGTAAPLALRLWWHCSGQAGMGLLDWPSMRGRQTSPSCLFQELPGNAVLPAALSPSAGSRPARRCGRRPRAACRARRRSMANVGPTPGAGPRRPAGPGSCSVHGCRAT